MRTNNDHIDGIFKNSFENLKEPKPQMWTTLEQPWKELY